MDAMSIEAMILNQAGSDVLGGRLPTGIRVDRGSEFVSGGVRFVNERLELEAA